MDSWPTIDTIGHTRLLAENELTQSFHESQKIAEKVKPDFLRTIL